MLGWLLSGLLRGMIGLAESVFIWKWWFRKQICWRCHREILVGELVLSNRNNVRRVWHKSCYDEMFI